jgi:hyaluronoglucosaminidase
VAWGRAGLIEGFYGPPWTWAARAEVARACHERGMDLYLYAAKDDPLHRERWREPYPPAELDEFAGLIGEGTLDVGFCISPGLSIDSGSASDRDALAAKVDQVVGLGVRVVALLLDDIPVRPGLGPEHAALTSWLWEHLADRAELLLVPTEYAGIEPSPYLDALAADVPPAVPIGWTGRRVVCDTITIADAAARAAALGGRAPFVWDNFPVNDAIMGDRLFLGPLRGREPGLDGVCSGYVANAMVQPRASILPLASVAGYLAGEDPDEAWARAAGPLRTFAEACDSERPRQLVAAAVGAGADPAALDDLHDWLRAASECRAPGLEDEVGPWLDQVHEEARVGRMASRLLRSRRDGATDPTGESSLGLALSWQALRRATVTVMGPRCSVKPVLWHDTAGGWRWDPASVEIDGNAVDTLVRAALAAPDPPG